MKVRFDVSKLRIRTCRIDARHNALSPGMRIVRGDAKPVTKWHVHADVPNICETAVATSRPAGIAECSARKRLRRHTRDLANSLSATRAARCAPPRNEADGIPKFRKNPRYSSYCRMRNGHRDEAWVTPERTSHAGRRCYWNRRWHRNSPRETRDL